MTKKIFFIAGEASGDLIASKVMKNFDNEYTFFGVGGTNMESLDFKSIFNIKDTSIMGFFEILFKLPTILKRIKQTVSEINKIKPDLIVTIDSPGFAKAVVGKLRKNGYTGKISHIVAPTVWAYKEKRAIKMAKLFDEIYCFFDFEPKYFEKYGLKAHFVGNISIEDELMVLKNKNNKQDVYRYNNIAITLGSRETEVKRHMKIMMNVMKSISKTNSDVIFILPTLPFLSKYIKSEMDKIPVKYKLLDDKNAINEAIKICDIAIAKSGTNNLQFLINQKPIITYYKTGFITHFILKLFIKIKFINLVNIIANKELVPEFVQNDFTSQNVISKFNDLQINSLNFEEINGILLKMLPIGANKKPSEKTASLLKEFIDK